jgi:hypothetical protein
MNTLGATSGGTEIVYSNAATCQAVYSATMIGGHIGPVGAAILLLIFAVHLFPLWRIISRMGYPGILAIFAFVPGLDLILAYFLALSDWPVLRRLNAFRQE